VSELTDFKCPCKNQSLSFRPPSLAFNVQIRTLSQGSSFLVLFLDNLTFTTSPHTGLQIVNRFIHSISQRSQHSKSILFIHSLTHTHLNSYCRPEILQGLSDNMAFSQGIHNLIDRNVPRFQYSVGEIMAKCIWNHGDAWGRKDLSWNKWELGQWKAMG